VSRDPRHGRRSASRTKSLPPVGVIEVLSVDTDGFALARPAKWTETATAPEIRLEPERAAGRAFGAGERVLA
jgi:hypothetical protein